VTDRELGRGRHRHQPRCRHRSCASHKPTHCGPRQRRAEHDSRRSPRSRECCTDRWWQRARWLATKMRKGDNTTHPGCPILSTRTFGGRRQLPRVKIDASRFALTHGRGSVSARGGAGPTGPRFPGVLIDQLVVMEFSKCDGARSRSRALVVMGRLESPCRSSAVSVLLSPP
jgi:hypothetical protein